MGTDTKIQWTTHTWSPWRGCTHGILPDGTEHPGCQHCYAETLSKRNSATLGIWGPDGTRVIAADKSWQQVRRWNAEAAKSGEFCGIFPSLCDPFECDENAKLADGVTPRAVMDHLGNSLCTQSGLVAKQWPSAPGWRPLMLTDVRERLFELIDATPALTWQLLTKRPQNVRRMWPARDRHYDGPGWNSSLGNPHYRPNVQLITSVSDQATADALIPELLKCRDLCPVLGLSCEPLLGPIDLERHLNGGHTLDEWNERALSGHDPYGFRPHYPRIDWVIVGGESGHGARPCNVEWIRDIVKQCKAAGVPCFVKQLGAMVHATSAIDPLDQFPGNLSFFQGPDIHTACIKLRDSKGGDPEEWPEDLRVRQMPEVR